MNKKDYSDLMLWLATLPPTTETTEDWYNRVFNDNLNDIDLESKVTVELNKV